MGAFLLEAKECSVVRCTSDKCKLGISALRSSDCLFQDDAAKDCQKSGFRLYESLRMKLDDLKGEACQEGLSLINSRLCQAVGCTMERNQKSGISLTTSHMASLAGNTLCYNDVGLSLIGSNACILEGNNASFNKQSGLELEQLSGAEMTQNKAYYNGQGLFLQSSKRVTIKGNDLSFNTLHGLRMSASSGCNVTENIFKGNEASGINMVDCQENWIYHNTLRNNSYDNALDNGKNHWDAGPKVGGNYWSDHDVSGNPGRDPRKIMTSGQDRYPFQCPGGWN
jgi:parallel beta-helix repeat protein